MAIVLLDGLVAECSGPPGLRSQRSSTREPMSKINPPFRADHVGSLLRTPAIHEARARWRAGDLDAAGLREIEDREIAAMIPALADTGIRSITDGEFRR